MKTKFLYIAALALLVSFTACENETPFDTQSPNDDPIILKPYNESGTGSFTYNIPNPETPLLDSVTVTPSKYTTVNWYLDGQLVHTGTRIEMCFLAGKYNLTIEAVTTAGKRTERYGTVTVNPNPTDPYSEAPAGGRHEAPNSTVGIDGANLSAVQEVHLTNDVFGVQIVKEITPSSVSDSRVEFTLPEMEDGTYFVRLVNAQNMRYGANTIQVHNNAVVLSGYEEFAPGETWTITGLNLANVSLVRVGTTEITALTATANKVTLTAPELEEGTYELSMQTSDGAAVQFITANGAEETVMTKLSRETVLWTGPVALDWNADLVNITAAQMADVPVGSTILVYFDLPEAEYHNLRITTPWWGDNLVDQFDVTPDTPNPFTFVYDDRCKGIVDMVGSWSIVGFGETINKITYK